MELQELISGIIKSGSRYGLVINKGKTKVMATQGNNVAITIDGDTLQQVDHFQYLGAMITDDGKCEADMRSGLGMARSVLSGGRRYSWKRKTAKSLQ